MSYINKSCHVQPIADRVAQNLEIISENFPFQYQAYEDSHGIYHEHHSLAGNNHKSHGQNFFLVIGSILATCFIDSYFSHWLVRMWYVLYLAQWLIHIRYAHVCDLKHPYDRAPSDRAPSFIFDTWLIHFWHVIWHDVATSDDLSYVHYDMHTHKWISHVSNMNEATCYRVAKTHRIPYLYRSFSTKVTSIPWLFLWKMICILGDPMSFRHAA